MDQRVKVGVIGCGAISGAYFGMAKNFPIVEVVAAADLDLERAKAKAQEFNIPKACSVEELLDDPQIELVMNLTVPKAHIPVGIAAIEKGKHVYAEKPLGINRQEGLKLMEVARKHDKRVGCAPDTFMGSGIQTARQLIEQGAIGQPVGFDALMMGRGHEHWHPSPEFYYEVGGGPMFDMGPYYLTALLNILGPVKRLMGMASISRPQRPITHLKDGAPGPKFGKIMNVETPDQVFGTMEFENGCIGSIVMSFASAEAEYNHKQPITIYGTTGTLRVPDPNGFDGTISIRGWDDKEWRDVEPTFVKGYGRSIGAADMAYAIRSGRDHRANGEQAMAVLDLMQGFLDSSDSGQAYKPVTRYTKPKAMPADLPFGQLDR